MMAQRILRALQQIEISNGHVRDAARAGFLEWVFGLPNGADTAAQAQYALSVLHVKGPASPAAHLFLDYLEQATVPQKPPVRRGGRKRVMH